MMHYVIDIYWFCINIHITLMKLSLAFVISKILASCLIVKIDKIIVRKYHSLKVESNAITMITFKDESQLFKREQYPCTWNQNEMKHATWNETRKFILERKIHPTLLIKWWKNISDRAGNRLEFKETSRFCTQKI